MCAECGSSISLSLYPHPPFPGWSFPGETHQLQGVWREGCGVGVLYLRTAVLGSLLVPLQGCAHLPLRWELRA